MPAEVDKFVRHPGRRASLLGLAAVAAVVFVSCMDTPVAVPRLPAPPPADPWPPKVDPLTPRCAASPSDVTTEGGTLLGQLAFTANGCVQPHGEPTEYYFEYGKTEAYGQRTVIQPLPPRRAAHYHESWDKGLAGWAGGINGRDLELKTGEGDRGSTGAGGFVRFNTPTGDDANHEDGIGYVQLPEYLHIGTYVQDGLVTASLGGGDPDFRDAFIAVDVRGNNFVPNGAELVFWAQADSDLAEQNHDFWRRANWAYTGFNLTDAALDGKWQRVAYRLQNDSRLWSYGGASVGQRRDSYQYWPIDNVLGHLNCNFFHMLSFVALYAVPTGSIDFDEIDVTYRNHSLLFPSNGARIVSSPRDAADPAPLTDGWRFGAGKTWQSAPNPREPQEFTYVLANPVTIDVVQIHQDPTFPSREVEVLVSPEGASWVPLTAGSVPGSSPQGSNFTHYLARGLDAPAQWVKIRILSGYQPERWGLGEVEIFGSGAVMATDDDWYAVNTDIQNLERGSTYHYRLVTKSGSKITFGRDQSFAVPEQSKPAVLTGQPSRVNNRVAKLEGRLDPFGKPTTYFFEYGTSTSYGLRTTPAYAGVGATERTVIAYLNGLEPGTTYHYRLVAQNDEGIGYGSDGMFVAR